jgi:diacylglycerol diphosphate phosphatase/phosphatidate phosphatase
LSLVVMYELLLRIHSSIKLPFHLNDPDISNPHRKCHFPFWLAHLGWYVLPGVIMTLCIFFMRHSERRPSIFFTLVALIVATRLTMITGTLLKMNIGRLRPDFLDRCQPIENYNGWTDESICKGDHYLIERGRKSFPSNHSSTAFCGITFLTLWTIQLFGLNEWTAVHGLLWLLSGISVGLSRVQCFRHFPTDIIGGAVVGTFCSVLSFIVYRRRIFFSKRKYELLNSE